MLISISRYFVSIVSILYRNRRSDIKLATSDVDEKHERRRVASLPVSSVFKDCHKLTVKQFLVNYTSASGSLKLGMVIIEYFSVAAKLIEPCFQYVSRFSVHNVRAVFHVLTTVLVKKNLRKQHLVRLFCSLKSLSLVVNIVAVAKFGVAIISYLPVNILFQSCLL